MKNLSARHVVAASLVFAVQGLGCSQGPPAPTPLGVVVTSISPATGSASGGTPVTINGSGFQAGATLALSGTATDATVVNDHVMTAVMPERPGGGVVWVTVTNPDGKSGSLANAYLYVAPPTIVGVFTSPGSTGGGANFSIKGIGFEPGAIVTFGTAQVRGSVYLDRIYGVTPPHDAGAVDVVVTNVNGGTTTLAAGYTFVPPASLDFNGDWEGGAGYEEEVPLTFSIRDNRLVAMTCGGAVSGFAANLVPLLPTPEIVDGQFSLTSENGTITGWIVSGDQASGQLDVKGCQASIREWSAWKLTK